MYRSIAFIVSVDIARGRPPPILVRFSDESRMYATEDFANFHFLATALRLPPASRSCRMRDFWGVVI